MTATRPKRDCSHTRVRHVHGTPEAYNRDACRCQACTAANTARQAARRRRLAYMHWHGQTMWTTPHGTVRRLEALAAAGWPLPEIAARLGVTRSAVHALRSARHPRVLTTTANRVAAVYDQLWHVTPPAGRGGSYAAALAAGHGWAEPWQWADRDIDDPNAEPAPIVGGLDEIAVERLMAGMLVLPKHTHSAERIEAIRRLAKAGWNDTLIGVRMRCTPCNILALRLRNGIPAGQPRRVRRAA